MFDLLIGIWVGVWWLGGGLILADDCYKHPREHWYDTLYDLALVLTSPVWGPLAFAVVIAIDRVTGWYIAWTDRPVRKLAAVKLAELKALRKEGRCPINPGELDLQQDHVLEWAAMEWARAEIEKGKS